MLKLILISLLINLAFGKFRSDPCREGVDDSICEKNGKSGKLIARFNDAEAGGCSPYSPFITRKKYKCNKVRFEVIIILV